MFNFQGTSAPRLIGDSLVILAHRFLFVLPYIFRKDDDFAMYHAKQGMNLFIAGIIGDLVGGFLGFGWLVALARIAFAIMGVSNVIKGLKKPLPYIGNIFK